MEVKACEVRLSPHFSVAEGVVVANGGAYVNRGRTASDQICGVELVPFGRVGVVLFGDAGKRRSAKRKLSETVGEV